MNTPPTVGRLLRLVSSCSTIAAGLRNPAVVAALAGSLVSLALAEIPDIAKADPLYAKGYLVATHYPDVFNNGTNAATTTAGLQMAINDARGANLALYLPAGTYLINDTLRAYTNTDQGSPTSPRSNPVVVVGSTAGPRRPLIKLEPNTTGFMDAANPRVMLEFKNFDTSDYSDPKTEKPNQGYSQMLRGVDFDCGRNPGAIGVYCNQAQDSSVENVKVEATGAHTGFRGLPSRAWGAVNIEVEGGQYGVDTLPDPKIANTARSYVGGVIAGLILRNQTVSAIRNSGQTLTVVGFEIVSPTGSTVAPITIYGYGSANADVACLALIDGVIRRGDAFAGPAVSNPFGRSIYLRSVSVTGSASDALVLSGSNPANTVTAAGTWKRIDEYSHCNQGDVATAERETWTLIDGVASRTPADFVRVTSDAPPAADDIVRRHVWAALPSVDDADAFDPVAAGEIVLDSQGTATLAASTFQEIIDTHPKVFLPKGTYRLQGPITLATNTVLFGAARHLTTIEVDDTTWRPTQETTFITTADSPHATTHLGDLALGVPSAVLAHDFFTALDWQAGGNSMVHIGSYYHNPESRLTTTNDHSLVKIRNSGGGRWYFLSRRDSRAMQHKQYRMVEVTGTRQPLWIYGLNLEHARSDAFAEFNDARNIRIYGIKTEFAGEFGDNEIFRNSTLLSFNNVQNTLVVGHTSVRHAPAPAYSIIEFKGGSTRVTTALLIPQQGYGPALRGNTLSEGAPGLPAELRFDTGVALFKRDTMTIADEVTMTHAGVSYAPPPGYTPPSVALTYPAEAAVLPLAPTALAATVQATGRPIASVKFYANGSLIGKDTIAPYSAAWIPPAGGQYRLNAVATDIVGAAALSPTVTVSVSGPPAVPTNLSGTPGMRQIALSWSIAPSGAASYNVKRATVAGGPFVKIGETTMTSYTDATVLDATYHYVVSAVNGYGESADSAPVSVAPIAGLALTSIAPHDGWVLESSVASEQGGSLDSTGNGTLGLRIGDDAARKQYKSIVSFDTSQLPAGAVVLSASLELRRGGYQGTLAALPAFGELRVDLCNGGFSGDVALQNTDFQAAATVPQVAVLNFPAANNDWAKGNLNQAGLDAINRGGPTQFRVYFANPDNGDAVQNTIGFFTGGHVDAVNWPVLRLQYAFPPAITSHPATQAARVGDTVSFSVAASGSTPLSYTWRRNGLPITGNASAHTATLTLSSVTTAAAGTYDCVVSNQAGSTTSGEASLTVQKAQAAVTLSGLNRVYTGSPLAATVVTTPAGLPTAVTYDGASSVPKNVGSYAVAATVMHPDYFGSAQGTLVIAPAPATVTLGQLAQTYDGAPKPVTVTTTPAGLSVHVTYNGSSSPPTNAGTYAVTATVTDVNYIGSTSGLLTVAKTSAVVALEGLDQLYDGQPRVVTAKTVPAGLRVVIAYDSPGGAPPTAPGSYSVTATVDEPNYSGATSGTLRVITPVTVRHAPEIHGAVDGSVHLLLPEDVALKGKAWVSGDLLVPGMPAVLLGGGGVLGATIEGTGNAAPAEHTLTLVGEVVLGRLVRRTDAVSLPAIAMPPLPTGTRDLVLNSARDDAGDLSTVRNLTVGGNPRVLTLPASTYESVIVNGHSTLVLGAANATKPSVYNLQSLALNGGSSLVVVGPVVINVAESVTFDGPSGDPEHAAWLTLNVARGGLTLNGSATFNGCVAAPSGAVTLNGTSVLRGRVTADRLTVGSGAVVDTRAAVRPGEAGP